MRIGSIRSALAALVIASVTAPGEGVAQTPGLTGYLDGLRRASCPAGTKETKAGPIAIKATAVSLQGLNPGRKTVGQLTYVGGFQLTSDDQRFGGLSGLDLLDDGNLLAVSDTGEFVWIDLAEDGFTPVAARLSAMNDLSGKPFPTKGAGDAEGLAVIGDMALVSFEGNHRVLAYEIGKCGAAARGAPVGWKLGDTFTRKKIKVDSNQGVEALAVTPDWYLFAGIETKVGNASPLSARPIEASPRFDLTIAEKAPELVGLDLLPAGKDGADVKAFSLHRSTSPFSGNAIAIVETDFERYLDQTNLPARVISETDERKHYRLRKTASRTLAEMNVLLTIDNFEGIAAKQMPDGRVRLFIVSDDNFSANQRTLLMVFDVAKRD